MFQHVSHRLFCLQHKRNHYSSWTTCTTNSQRMQCVGETLASWILQPYSSSNTTASDPMCHSEKCTAFLVQLYTKNYFVDYLYTLTHNTRCVVDVCIGSVPHTLPWSRGNRFALLSVCVRVPTGKSSDQQWFWPGLSDICQSLCLSKSPPEHYLNWRERERIKSKWMTMRERNVRNLYTCIHIHILISMRLVQIWQPVEIYTDGIIVKNICTDTGIIQKKKILIFFSLFPSGSF